jgi:hypothetical protein
MVVRRFLEHPPHFLTRAARATVAPVSAREIHACRRKIRDSSQERFKRCDAFCNLVLIQEASTQEPEAIRFPGKLRLERAQQTLGSGSTPSAQRRLRLAQARLEADLGYRRAHGVSWPPFASCQYL